MGLNTANLKVKKVAIHKIFQREEKDTLIPPMYNNSCTELDGEARIALALRIVKAFGDDSHSLKMDIADTGEESVYKNIVNFWLSEQSDEQFLELSKKLTLLLALAQDSKVYSEGVVITVKGTTKATKNDFIAVIKAEIQDGFNIAEINGQQLLSYINTLLLTRQQKLHKIGLFVNNQVKGRAIEVKDVSAFVFDSNTAESAYKAKAEFFYGKFLGLEFSKDSAVVCNSFYVQTKAFINKCEVEPMEKMRLHTALRDYVFINPTSRISPSEFADTYFMSSEIIDKYLEELDNVGVPRTATIKDLKMIGNKNHKRNLKFDNSVIVQVPTEEFDEAISVNEDENGNTIVTIRGRYVNEK